MKFVAFIPAHMASVRFPGKVLHPFYGLPMIEHVRRRALFADSLQEVYVATCDEEIKATIERYGGSVIMTDNTHTNGTSRVAQAVQEIDCTHVLLLQADEPLLMPGYIDQFFDAISNSDPSVVAWNATGPIENPVELDRHSFVKCQVNNKGRILTCFRRSPCYSDFDQQRKFIRKILGIIAFRKSFLLEIANTEPTPIETAEFIEQMRIIEHENPLMSVAMQESLPSVNEPGEADEVEDYLKNHPEQKRLLEQVLSMQA